MMTKMTQMVSVKNVVLVCFGLFRALSVKQSICQSINNYQSYSINQKTIQLISQSVHHGLSSNSNLTLQLLQGSIIV